MKTGHASLLITSYFPLCIAIVVLSAKLGPISKDPNTGFNLTGKQTLGNFLVFFSGFMLAPLLYVLIYLLCFHAPWENTILKAETEEARSRIGISNVEQRQRMAAQKPSIAVICIAILGVGWIIAAALLSTNLNETLDKG